MAKANSKTKTKRNQRMMQVAITTVFELPYESFFEGFWEDEEETEAAKQQATSKAKREVAALNQLVKYTDEECGGNILGILGDWSMGNPDSWEVEVTEK